MDPLTRMRLLDPSGTRCAYETVTPVDGNGNVIGLVDMATGTKSATYDYNTFGETVQSDGVASVTNHFRFSTKYTDDETGLIMYPLRPYPPATGRFLCKDPSEEQGGLNLYGFVSNDGINSFDPLGLSAPTVHPSTPAQLRAMDVATLTKVADGWRAQNWDFAANLLTAFYTGQTSYTPTPADIEKIKQSSEYRSAAQKSLAEMARKLCAEGKGGTHVPISNGHAGGPYAFEPRYWSGELLWALGGSHFYYTGTMTVCCSGDNPSWAADVTMSQEDPYTFENAGFLHWRQMVPSFAAARHMEENHWATPFVHTETWQDKFSQ